MCELDEAKKFSSIDKKETESMIEGIGSFFFFLILLLFFFFGFFKHFGNFFLCRLC